jgi:orotidine-5'-phosphate decarboxylase
MWQKFISNGENCTTKLWAPGKIPVPFGPPARNRAETALAGGPIPGARLRSTLEIPFLCRAALCNYGYEEGDPLDPRLIVALDYPEAAPAITLVERLDEVCCWYKVGLELYLAEGNTFIHELHHRGCSVFLDLKLYDIPNTVAGAVRSVAETGAEMLTVHASGGPAMLRAAADAAAAFEHPPQLLAVTVLTSMDAEQLAAVGIGRSAGAQVLRLAEIAAGAGITGLVASAEETASLRQHFPGATLVIPGIRPAGSEMGDQKRVATPSAALAAGASYLVVGRPITQASDPVAAAEAIVSEMHEATEVSR